MDHKPASYPDHAKVVFEWYRFNIYERKKIESDDKEYIYHGIHRKDSVSIFATQWDRILLPKFIWSYKWDYIGVFGWIIDIWWDDYMQVAQQELLEEAGMQSNDRSLYNTYQYHGTKWHVHFLIAKNCHTIAPQTLAWAEWNVEILKVSFDTFLTMAINNEIKWIPYCLVDLCKAYYDPIIKEKLRKQLFDIPSIS